MPPYPINFVHIGAITIRFFNGTPRIENGLNSFVIFYISSYFLFANSLDLVSALLIQAVIASVK